MKKFISGYVDYTHEQVFETVTNLQVLLAEHKDNGDDDAVRWLAEAIGIIVDVGYMLE